MLVNYKNEATDLKRNGILELGTGSYLKELPD